MIASVSGAVLNIILNMIFIPKFGFVAAGYTTLLCYVLYAVAHYIFMVRVSRIYMNREKIYDLKIILVIGIGLLLASAIVMLLYPMPILRYVLITLMILIGVIKRNQIKKYIMLFINIMQRG
jgi:O-antigen/teichoic acid export membrane protein